MYEQCRRQPYPSGSGGGPRAGELPVVLLLGPPGSGKSSIIEGLQKIGERRPNGQHPFIEGEEPRPYEVAASLAKGLALKLKRIPVPPFPRLRVGLIAVDPQLNLDPNPAVAVTQLKSAIRGPREANPRDETFTRVLDALPGIVGFQVPGWGLLTSTLLSLPKLPHALAQRTGLAWYGNPNRPLHGLIALNQQSKRATKGDKEAVDRKLVAAFLADLRAAYKSQSHDRRCVVFLDDIDRPGGLAFLAHLTAARDANQGISDPLLVVATASTSKGVPAPRDAESHRLVIHHPDRTPFQDWANSVTTAASRHYYCIDVGPLPKEEAGELNPPVAMARPAALPVVHALARGHGGGVQRLLKRSSQLA
ncbi:AAA family ATPase [Streptomyces sp. NPDC003710]